MRPCSPVRASRRVASLPTGLDHAVLVGNRRLLAEHGIALDPPVEAMLGQLDARGETALLVAVDGEMAGVIGVHDAIRPEAHDVIHDLRHLKIKEIAILTGDREPAARAVAKRIHADTVAAELLPADKARWIEERRAAGRQGRDGRRRHQRCPGAGAGRRGDRPRRHRRRPRRRGGQPDHPRRPAPRPAGPGRVVPRARSRSSARTSSASPSGSTPWRCSRPRSASSARSPPRSSTRSARCSSCSTRCGSSFRTTGPSWRRHGDPPPRGRTPGRSIGSTTSVRSSTGRGDPPGHAAGPSRRAWLCSSRMPRAAGPRSGRGMSACPDGSAGIAGTLDPGLHLRWPYPIEWVRSVAPDRVRGLADRVPRAGQPQADDPGMGRQPRATRRRSRRG